MVERSDDLPAACRAPGSASIAQCVDVAGERACLADRLGHRCGKGRRVASREEPHAGFDQLAIHHDVRHQAAHPQRQRVVHGAAPGASLEKRRLDQGDGPLQQRDLIAFRNQAEDVLV